jgi:hypothetical protein
LKRCINRKNLMDLLCDGVAVDGRVAYVSGDVGTGHLFGKHRIIVFPLFKCVQ